jgi:hypothetical protein
MPRHGLQARVELAHRRGPSQWREASRDETWETTVGVGEGALNVLRVGEEYIISSQS